MKKVVLLLVLLMGVMMIVGCSTPAGVQNDIDKVSEKTGEPVKTDEELIKEVVVAFEKAQNNISYETVTGTEGIEFASQSAKEEWLESEKDKYLLNTIKDNKLVIKFGEVLDFKVTNLDKEKGEADAVIVFTTITTHKNGKEINKKMEAQSDIRLLKENNLWKISIEKIKVIK